MSEEDYQAFLNRLPIDRRIEIEKVWQIARDNMPDGYKEIISSKYLSFCADNMWYIALANQKNYISLHLLPIYMFPELKAKLDNSGRKIKGGKGCLNFKKAEELPVEIIGEIIAAIPFEDYKAHIEKARKKDKVKA
jgi:hypothetical protein